MYQTIDQQAEYRQALLDEQAARKAFADLVFVSFAVALPIAAVIFGMTRPYSPSVDAGIAAFLAVFVLGAVFYVRLMASKGLAWKCAVDRVKYLEQQQS